MDIMAELKEKFVKGCLANPKFRIGEWESEEKARELIEKIWKDWEAFASYAFNKSHSVCYAWIAYQTGYFNKSHAVAYAVVSYQTAYLKAHYPAEFMCAQISSEIGNFDKLPGFVAEAQEIGLDLRLPDVNESGSRFVPTPDSKGIRYGLGGIKGVGEMAADAIVAEREANGPYKDIFDFMERVNFGVVNKKCLENLAYAGGFDSICEFNRSKFFAVDDKNSAALPYLEQLVRYGQRVQQEKVNAQQSLFGGGSMVDIQRPTLPVADDWNQLQLLNKEREVIGLYLSAHPLDEYKVIIDHMCKAQLTDLEDLEQFNGQEIAVSGVVTSVQSLTTKTGRPWGRFTLEDYNGTREFALFGKDYEKFRPQLYVNYFLFVKGKVQPRPYGDNPELEFKVLSMMQLAEVQDTMIKELHINIPIEELTPTFVTDFADRVRANSKKKSNVILRMTITDRAGGTTLNMYSKRYKITLEQDLIDYLDRNEMKYTLS